MTNNEQAYKELVQDYKKLKQTRDLYSNELSEKKGNLAAYQTEQEELIAKAKQLNVDPKNLKQEIEKMIKEIQNQLLENQKVCDEIDQTQLG